MRLAWPLIGLVDRVVDDLPEEVVVAARESVPPMYIAGRMRTGSRPSRTSMSSAVYDAACAGGLRGGGDGGRAEWWSGGVAISAHLRGASAERLTVFLAVDLAAGAEGAGRPWPRPAWAWRRGAG